MKKLLFIDHSYHKKTKSSDFFIDYLKAYYDVTVLWNTSWNDGIQPQIDNVEASKYECIIFWQLIHESFVKKLNHNNIIFIPMFDGVSKSYNFWVNYRKIKIINFSRALHDILIHWGFNSFYIQYFIPPCNNINESENNEVFFWQRHTNININTLESIFSDERVKVHMHTSADPNHTFIMPSKEQEKKFSISYSTWFDTKEKMQNLIKSKTFYIAPREEEGIGMTFLEAMSMGKIVIANNAPTMNEYITHGYNGFLFDIDNPNPIEFNNLSTILKNVKEYINHGYESWLENRHDIIDFINSPQIKAKFRCIFLIYILKKVARNTKNIIKTVLLKLRLLRCVETSEEMKFFIFGILIKQKTKRNQQ